MPILDTLWMSKDALDLGKRIRQETWDSPREEATERLTAIMQGINTKESWE